MLFWPSPRNPAGAKMTKGVGFFRSHKGQRSGAGQRSGILKNLNPPRPAWVTQIEIRTHVFFSLKTSSTGRGSFCRSDRILQFFAHPY
jgi:hypothetical protein